VVSTGIVTTLAGSAGSPGSADGTGIAARFDSPSGVAVDRLGSVYVADTLNHTVRKVTSAGVVSTLAGLSGSSGNADGIGSAARFSAPQGLAIGGNGYIYVADTNNNIIRKIDISNGAVTTMAAMPFTVAVETYCGFSAPTGVAIDGTGNIYVSDMNNQRISGITPSAFFNILAGAVTIGAAPVGADDGTGQYACFNFPSGVATDPSGNLYVADTDNNTIRKVVTAGYGGTAVEWDYGIVTTSAGVAGTSGSADGLGSAVRFFGPTGIALDNNGDIFVADTNNDTIRIAIQPTAPAIQTQPQSQTLAIGGNAQFSVTATGYPAITYQWYFNGTAITGATNSSYSLSNVQSVNGGTYTVQISNSIGSLTSTAATLTVTTPTSPPSAGGGSGGGGGGAPSTLFLGMIFLLATIHALQTRTRKRTSA
jgi:sugar lactone lactonase YvrE